MCRNLTCDDYIYGQIQKSITRASQNPIYDCGFNAEVELSERDTPPRFCTETGLILHTRVPLLTLVVSLFSLAFGF